MTHDLDDAIGVSGGKPTGVSVATTRVARPGDRGFESHETSAESHELDEDERPQFIDDRLIERMITGAKLLVVVVYLGAVVTFVVLALGFVLMLFGASPEAPFVDWAYRNTAQAMKPFRGMFPVRDIDGRSVFDASLLFAAAFYGFLAIGLHAVVEYLSALARTFHRQSTPT